MRRLRLRRGEVRRRWHLVRGHLVLGTVVRNVRSVRGKYEFYFQQGWKCLDCSVEWPR